MVLTMMPATVAADGEAAAHASETAPVANTTACGADRRGIRYYDAKNEERAVRPAATQYTYTLHYDTTAGSGAAKSERD